MQFKIIFNDQTINQILPYSEAISWASYLSAKYPHALIWLKASMPKIGA